MGKTTPKIFLPTIFLPIERIWLRLRRAGFIRVIRGLNPSF